MTGSRSHSAALLRVTRVLLKRDGASNIPGVSCGRENEMGLTTPSNAQAATSVIPLTTCFHFAIARYPKERVERRAELRAFDCTADRLSACTNSPACAPAGQHALNAMIHFGPRRPYYPRKLPLDLRCSIDGSGSI